MEVVKLATVGKLIEGLLRRSTFRRSMAILLMEHIGAIA